MVADTTTPSLQLLLQGTGNNNNAWGDNLNDQVISRLDTAVAGVTVLSGLTGGDVELTNDQALSSTLVLTGALTSKLTIIVANRPKQWRIINDTTGDFVTLIKTAVGSPRNIPTKKVGQYTCIGNGAIYRADAHTVGEYFFHSGNDVPPGALECTNALKKRADFVDLFSAIGTKFGSTDSTDFKLPPGYDTGRYLRSRTASLASGTIQANQNKTHTHDGSGTTSTESANHFHTGSGSTGVESANHDHLVSGSTGAISNDHAHVASGATAGMNGNNPHLHTGASGALFQGNSTGVSGVQGGSPYPIVIDGTLGYTSYTNIDHSHSFSVSTSGVSANHTHVFTAGTGIQRQSHTHSVSVTTGNQNVSHTHTYSFTTGNGSADGSEARPESLVGILCIRY